MRDEDWGSSTYYHRADGKQALSSQDVVYFTGHGFQSGDYSHRNESQIGLRLDYVNSIGKHEIKAGIESYSTNLRVYQISQGYEIYEQISKLEIPTGNPLIIQFDEKLNIINSKYLDRERAKSLLVY